MLEVEVKAALGEIGNDNGIQRHGEAAVAVIADFALPSLRQRKRKREAGQEHGVGL